VTGRVLWSGNRADPVLAGPGSARGVQPGNSPVRDLNPSLPGNAMHAGELRQMAETTTPTAADSQAPRVHSRRNAALVFIGLVIAGGVI
jgi:hypothetical protein